jgi:hypothetical protein
MLALASYSSSSKLGDHNIWLTLFALEIWNTFLLSISACCFDVHSLPISEYKVHSHNRNGLCAVAFMDDHYPVRSAFSLLNQVPTMIPEIPTCLCFWLKLSLPIVSCSQSFLIQFCLEFVNLNSVSHNIVSI